MHDPFDVSGPVSGDSNFFGRRDEAIDLARKLQSGQIRSCLGIRKIGKTSIINRVLKEIPASFDCETIMIDCSRDDVFELDATGLLLSIAETLKELQETNIGYANIKPVSSGVTLSQARSELERVIFSSNQVILLVFDEVDYVTPGSPTANHWRVEFNKFWRNLRVVYQECERQGKAFSLLIGGVSSHWFTVDEIEEIENAALAFVPEEFLNPMARGATVAMLRRLGKVAGLNFSEAAADLIAGETGNMPFWSRKCCSYIHRQIAISERPMLLQRSDVEPYVEQFVENEGLQIAEVAITHLFRVHPGVMEATKLIISNPLSEVPEARRRALVKYGVINGKGEFSGAMFKKAIEAVFEKMSEIQEPQSPLKNQNSELLSEWAEELAALGQRRNIIERKLRNVTLTFLRMNAMQTKRLDRLPDDILKAVSSARRKQLLGHSLDNIFQKLNWPELTEIISKHWITFEVIFGDKKEFESHAQIINDRPDAHAKEWDQADFALYRRSLQWFEDRAAKLQ